MADKDESTSGHFISYESTPIYIPPLTCIVNKKKSEKIQMNFLDNKTTISVYLGPRSTLTETLCQIRK